MEEKAEHKSGYKSIVHGQVVEEKRSIGWQVLVVMAGRQQEFWPGLLCGKNCCARSNLLKRTSPEFVRCVLTQDCIVAY